MVVKYRVVMFEYILKGYVCKFIYEEVVKESLYIWYLFYYLVMNLNKFGKFCIVFDVVVEYEGILFNKSFF